MQVILRMWADALARSKEHLSPKFGNGVSTALGGIKTQSLWYIACQQVQSGDHEVAYKEKECLKPLIKMQDK